MTPALIATTVLAAYALACWWLPFGRCQSCSGRGHRTTMLLHRIRTCRRCRGSGKRLRHGRRLYNHLSRVHREATMSKARGQS